MFVKVVNVITDIIIGTKSHLNNVADIYIRYIQHMSLLNCTSVIVADIIIGGKSDVINVADNYIGTINISI